MSRHHAAIEIIDVELPKCRFTTHATAGEVIDDCEDCGEQMVCGPFAHYCLKCDPYWAGRCRTCEAQRFECCC